MIVIFAFLNSRQSNLNHHYEVVHELRINNLYLHSNPEIFVYFECEMCDHKTREKRTLMHHIKVVHNKDKQPVLFCDMCNFSTIEMKTLNRHKKLYTKRLNNILIVIKTHTKLQERIIWVNMLKMFTPRRNKVYFLVICVILKPFKEKL